jgi:hypothetical protein
MQKSALVELSVRFPGRVVGEVLKLLADQERYQGELGGSGL